jgi:hypothetical protein
MSFYLTLPSNGSLKTYPNNTQSDFTIALEKPINLEEPYEVALAELNYSSNILVDIGKLTVEYNFNHILDYIDEFSTKITSTVEIGNGTKIEDLIKNLNEKIERNIIYMYFLHQYHAGKDFLHNRTLDRCNEILIKKRNSSNKEFVPMYFYKIKSESLYLLNDSALSTLSSQYTTNGGQFSYFKNKWIFPDEEKAKAVAASLGLKYDLFEIDDNLFGEIENIENNKFLKRNIYNKYKDMLMDKLKNIQIYNDDTSISTIFFEKARQAGQNNNKIAVENLNLYELIIPNFQFELKSTYVNLNSKLSESKISVSGLLSNLFPVLENNQIPQNTPLLVPSQITPINYIQIQTDCIVPQFIGGTQDRVLKIIPINSIDESNNIVSYFSTLHYVPVAKSQLSTINIRLADVENNPIKIYNNLSTVIAKLHFKPRTEQLFDFN